MWVSVTNTGLLIGLIVLGVVFLAIGVTQILLGARVIKRSSNLGIDVGKCKVLLIVIAVLAFFGAGGIMVMTLVIVTLCLNEDHQLLAGNVKPQKQSIAGADSGQRELDELLIRYKQYKEDGVITNAEYKKKVHEAVQKSLVE